MTNDDTEESPRRPAGRRAQDSVVQMIRRWWPLLLSAFTMGAAGGGTFSSYVVAPRQVHELTVRAAAIDSTILVMRRDLANHTERMALNRDSVVTLLSSMSSRLEVLVLDRCLSSPDRYVKRQLRCGRDGP